MNKFDTIITNLDRFKNDMYGFIGPRPHQYVAIRLVKYLHSDPLVRSKIEDWKERLKIDRKRVKKFYSYLKKKIIESELIPAHLIDEFTEKYEWFTGKVKFLFPDRFIDFAKETNLCTYLSFDIIFAQIKNSKNIPSKKDNLLTNFRFALIDLVESDEYLLAELKWLRYSLNYDSEMRVGRKKMLDFYYYYTDPIEIAKNNIHFNEDDYRECSLGIIDELTQEFQSRNLVNYWIDRYCQRAFHFNRSFYNEINPIIGAKKLTEDIFCKHFLLYLFDNGIDFSYDQKKEGFRPDIELTNSVIEVKYIREEDSKSKIRNALKTAISEVYQQSQSHPSVSKYILIFSENRKYKIVDCEFEGIIYKSVDFRIALYGDSPSKSKGEIIKPSELLNRG